MSRESPREKNSKHLDLRPEKRARARQPGIEYPRASESELTRATAATDDRRLNVLFICSRNQWRSPTAEKVWRSHPKLSVRSAGTSPNARRRVSAADLSWAEVIFVMEDKHKSRLKAEFPASFEYKPIHVLDIPDEYAYMDPELVETLQLSVGAILGLE